MGFDGIYPLVKIKLAMENGHRNSGFIHWIWWYSVVMLVYQRYHVHMLKTDDDHHTATLSLITIIVSRITIIIRI